MNRLISSIFIIVFFLIVNQLPAQEIYYVTESGRFVDSEEKANFSYIVEFESDDISSLSYSLKSNEKWGKAEFLQFMRKVSDSIYHISMNRNFKEYSVRQVISKSGDIIGLRQFNKDGKLEFECQAMKVFPLIMNGLNTYYDREGLPMAEESYVMGRRISEQFLFNPVDSTKQITEPPLFPGGIDNFRKHIALNVRYPIDAVKRGSVGQPYLKFRIDKNGQITDVNLARLPETDLSRELIRVIKSTKIKWQPAESNGEKIEVWYYATVKFVTSGMVF